jgi:UDP-N-acetylmuramoyl-L-alanyl-D-glutamate--2,6-diaminopimelate ligase
MSYVQTISDLLSSASINFSDECAPDLEVMDITLDSRQVKVGSLFCAVPGASVDGRDYIEQAIENGAAIILAEADGFAGQDVDTVPLIKVAGLSQKIGVLADAFFEHPSSEMQVFGVTGTNGKTTCCYLLAQAFTGLGHRAGIIGTLGSGEIGALQPASHTTPDAVSVHRRLAALRDDGFSQVCMEVSSHALDQARVAGLTFYATLFTNLSQDHLDYHGDMQTYAAAKSLLFTGFHSELSVVNADDELGQQIIDVADTDFMASFGEAGDVAAEEVTASENGLTFLVVGDGVEFEVQTPLVGLVNVPNVLMLCTTLLALSVSVTEIQELVGGLKPAPGRMELVTADGRPQVVIDYAHTPDALEKALLSVREHCAGELWCVFGCGGDRDKSKRPQMGAVAEQQADRLIITNDNPRSETPADIAEEIRKGIVAKDAVVILDRAEAISTAIAEAAPNDWILIAGKGHESTQTIGGDVLPFSDQQHAKAALEVAA